MSVELPGCCRNLFSRVEARVMFMGIQHDYVQVEGLCALTLEVMEFYVDVCKKGREGSL